MVSPSGRQNKNQRTKGAPKTNQAKPAAPSFPEIQEWHVVLGDNNCRKGRTTIATNILRQVKVQFQSKHSGSRRADWIPMAIDFFYTQLYERFAHGVAAPHGQIGQVLLRCTKKAMDMDRIQKPNVYGYPGDPKAMYGTVQSPLECLTFFLKSRDAPKLPGELARHERELAKLQGSSASLSPIASELVQEFAAHVMFFQQRVTKANQGNVVAKVLLDELNLIPTFRKVWKCLKDQEEEEDATASTEASPPVDTTTNTMAGQGHLDMVDSERSMTDPRNCSHLSTNSLAASSTPRQHSDRPNNHLFWTLNDPVLTNPVGPPFANNSRLDDADMIDDDCMASVYQDFQQDVDHDIESLFSQDRQECVLDWNPPRDSALEPPGRVLARTCRGIDPEPSLEFDSQESSLRSTHQTRQQIDHGEPLVGLEPDEIVTEIDYRSRRGELAGMSVSQRLTTNVESSPNDTMDTRIQSPHTPWTAEIGYLLGDVQPTEVDTGINSIVSGQEGNSVTLAQQQEAIPTTGFLGNHPELVCDIIPTIPDLGRGESGAVSVPTAVPVFGPDLGRGESGEISTLTSVCFAAPTTLDRADSEELTLTSFRRAVSDDSQASAESHHESIGVPVCLSQESVILNSVRIPECHVLPDMVPGPLHPKSCCSLEDLSTELDKHRKMFDEIKVDKNHPNRDTMLCFEKLLNFFQDQLDMANQGSITAKKLLEDLSATTAMKNQWKELEIQTHIPKDISLDCQEETSNIPAVCDCQPDNDDASASSCDAKTVLAITSPSSGPDDDDAGDGMVRERSLNGYLQEDFTNDEATFRTNQEIVVAYAARTQSFPHSPRRPDPPGRREEDPLGTLECITTTSSNPSDDCQSIATTDSEASHVVHGSRLRHGFWRIRQLWTGARRRRIRASSSQK